ncbi:MAG: FemAB family protein [Anaerolineales bacterium]|nr:FemAB family protein [Anaerolineales bacterium]MBM2850383.1 FemAB family protein [Anaerolineales bacterium]
MRQAQDKLPYKRSGGDDRISSRFPATESIIAHVVDKAVWTNGITDRHTWNTLISALPFTHILQSWEWGEFKRRYGWSARRCVWTDASGQPAAAAQVLRRRIGPPTSNLRLSASILYVPKGPLLDWGDHSLRARVLDDLQSLARRERAVFIKIDPDVSPPPSPPPSFATGGAITTDLQRRGWVFSRDQIQFRNTVTLDLRRGETELLAGMKQKTRYNVRLAEKKGVRIRPGALADLDLLYRLYAETSVRDGFVIRSADYYRDAWGSFIEGGLAQPFIAEVEGEPVGALILFKFARTAWYMYGMSREAHREKMPNHLLQWEAMRWAKAAGCETYDFWGAPDEFTEADPMWGVWKFKEGFGGQVVRHIGAWDYAPSPLLYRLYTAILPRVLDVMRWRGRRKTQASLD